MTKIICLCGSTRFRSAFELANMHETLKGNIVISVGLFGHGDHPDGSRFLTADGNMDHETKKMLDELHFCKIDLADEILVINIGNYIGESTKREIDYAKRHSKRVSYLLTE
jgi:hypothetical protein